MTVLELLGSFIGTRLLRTGLIKRSDMPTQEDFDKAYEADIEGIVNRVLAKRGM